MTDFPRNAVVPTHIHTMSRLMAGDTRYLTGGAGGGVTSTWVANAAIHVPFFLPWPYRVARAFWTNGTGPAGNSDIGIYTAGGALLWSAGSTANSGASALQFVTVSPDLQLQPGRYFLGYTNDGTTNRVFGIATSANVGRLAGYYQQTSAFPLPAAATFAASAALALPLMGLTNTASGF